MGKKKQWSFPENGKRDMNEQVWSKTQEGRSGVQGDLPHENSTPLVAPWEFQLTGKPSASVLQPFQLLTQIPSGKEAAT